MPSKDSCCKRVQFAGLGMMLASKVDCAVIHCLLDNLQTL